MAKLSYDERVQLLQDGKIDHLQFVMNSTDADDFLAWCKDRGIEPLPDTAELYLEMTELTAEEQQSINDLPDDE